MPGRALQATVSGSFRRAMSQVQASVYELTDRGARVLSPADPRVVDSVDGFVFLASDQTRSLRRTQDKHLAAIAASDLLWLVCPDGYVGTSAAMEIGYADHARVPVYATEAPSDSTLREYVTVVPGIAAALTAAARTAADRWPRAPLGLLLDPAGAVQDAHAQLDRLSAGLTSPAGSDPSAHARAVSALLAPLAR